MLTALGCYREGLSCGNPRFSFYEYEKYKVISVERVRVRHVARYRDSPHGGSTFLNITMWRDTHMDLEAGCDVVTNRNRSTRHVRVEPSKNDESKGIANVWYEASISSIRAENVLRENSEIEFGEEVQWTTSKLREEGVFKSLYRPAIAMVEAMDDIGCCNDNGGDPVNDNAMSATKTKVEEDLKNDLFW